MSIKQIDPSKIIQCPMPTNKLFVNLIGMRFGHLVVIGYVGKTGLQPDGTASHVWLCRCDCGAIKMIRGSAFKYGNTTSCGCRHRQNVRERSTKHGMTNSCEHMTWKAMKQRCYDPKSKAFPNYGARGIVVDPWWLGESGFAHFFEDMGYKPPGTQLDRIDNDGPYCKSNCRWATRKQQMRNYRRNRILEFRGERRPLIEWSEILGITRELIKGRLQMGWSVERALSDPVNVERTRDELGQFADETKPPLKHNSDSEQTSLAFG